MINKYISKALLYDERKNVIYSMLAYSFLFLINTLVFYSSLSSLRSGNFAFIETTPYFALTSIPFLPMAIICLVTIYQSYDNKDVKYTFMLTQPYSRDSILVTKSVGYIISYTIPIVLYGLLSILLLTINREIYGEHLTLIIHTLLLNLFFLFTILTAVAAIAQLMEMVFGKNQAAFSIPFGLFFMLALCIPLMWMFISDYIPFLKPALENLCEFLFESGGYAAKFLHFMLNPSFFSSLTLCIAALLIMYICILLNRRIKAENISGLFMFKFSEVLYKIILSLFSVMLLTLILFMVVLFVYWLSTGIGLPEALKTRYGLAGKERIEQIGNLILNVAWIPLFMLAYRLIGKFINRDNSSKSTVPYKKGRTA